MSKRELDTFLTRVTVLVIVGGYPNARTVRDPEIRIQRLVVRCILDANPLCQAVSPDP